jgi:hypothetical protein
MLFGIDSRTVNSIVRRFINHMVSSPVIDKVLRKHLSPILRESGFSKVNARKSWGWHGHCVWVLNVRAVGSHFSAVTGWPPMSSGVFIGVFYDFIPFEGHSVKVDERGRLIPEEWYCHLRSHLSCTLDQSIYTKHLPNPAERKRKDIWWLEPDGSNMVEAVENTALSFVDEGKPWFEKHTDLEATLAEIEGERDCYHKYYRAKYFAEQLGFDEKYRMYAELANEEKTRIEAIEI